MKKNNILKILSLNPVKTIGQNPVTIKIDKEYIESESTVLLKKRMKLFNQMRCRYEER